MLLQMPRGKLSSVRWGPEVGVDPVTLVEHKELLLTRLLIGGCAG